jgi:Rho-associated protein kinase 1
VQTVSHRFRSISGGFSHICSHEFRCRIKIHKEHADNNDPLAPCKLHHDPHSAREMLLLAQTKEDQSKWVSRLSKRIQKSGYKANSSTNNLGSGNIGGDGSKISPR